MNRTNTKLYRDREQQPTKSNHNDMQIDNDAILQKVAKQESSIRQLEAEQPIGGPRQFYEPMYPDEAQILQELEKEIAQRRAQKLEREQEFEALNHPGTPEYGQLMQDLKQMAKFDHTPRFPAFIVGKATSIAT